MGRDIQKQREAQRRYAERKRRENGVPIRPKGHDKKASNQSQTKRNAAFINRVKSLSKCAICNGKFHFCQMDFDHLPGTVKLKNVSAMTSSGYSISSIKDEMRKCQLICANCHRLVTWERHHLQAEQWQRELPNTGPL